MAGIVLDLPFHGRRHSAARAAALDETGQRATAGSCSSTRMLARLVEGSRPGNRLVHRRPPSVIRTRMHPASSLPRLPAREAPTAIDSVRLKDDAVGMNRTQPHTTAEPRCERSTNGVSCTEGAGGGAADAVEQVDGRWYCRGHLGAAKAVATKRRDRGFGSCSDPGCIRPAVESDGRCSEHRAGARAAADTVVIVDGTSGRGDHPYAPKLAEIYLALFPELGVLKVGKATPWTVGDRVRDAAGKLRIRQADSGRDLLPISCEARAWAVSLGDENMLWAVSERVEHAAAGRLALNVGATSVPYTEGKEWLRHDRIGDIDWPIEFHRAICETLEFLGHEAVADPPRSVE